MLLVSVCFAVGAACAFGTGTAIEHTVSAGNGGGLRGMLRLARDRRWLTGAALDVLGVALQVVALATGPVILVQPCLVLALPVALLVAWRLGAHRPSARQYRGCAWILAGLAGFFVAVGDPGDADRCSTASGCWSSGATSPSA
ncbi:DMT family transporter, partial [Dactylosporangium sp. NPDC005572]|uniref:DMT family transporter n=1 Tax=Dactylosporangium sp. NPDC005572 TaxID=3156889 RepID=UPI0033A02D02